MGENHNPAAPSVADGSRKPLLEILTDNGRRR